MRHRSTAETGTTVRPMPPSDELARWATIRQAGADARSATIANAPQPILDAIAWTVGATGVDSSETIEIIDRARASTPPYAWEQIAAAAGLDHDPTAVRNLRSRFSYLNRRRQES